MAPTCAQSTDTISVQFTNEISIEKNYIITEEKEYFDFDIRSLIVKAQYCSIEDVRF